MSSFPCLYSPTEIAKIIVQENDRIVCPGENVVLSCSVFKTHLLIWNVNSTTITCSSSVEIGHQCSNSNATINAVIKSVSQHPLVHYSNITSILTIANIHRRIEVSCSSQEPQSQAEYVFHLSRMWADHYIILNFVGHCVRNVLYYTSLYWTD